MPSWLLLHAERHPDGRLVDAVRLAVTRVPDGVSRRTLMHVLEDAGLAPSDSFSPWVNHDLRLEEAPPGARTITWTEVLNSGQTRLGVHLTPSQIERLKDAAREAGCSRKLYCLRQISEYLERAGAAFARGLPPPLPEPRPLAPGETHKARESFTIRLPSATWQQLRYCAGRLGLSGNELFTRIILPPADEHPPEGAAPSEKEPA